MGWRPRIKSGAAVSWGGWNVRGDVTLLGRGLAIQRMDRAIYRSVIAILFEGSTGGDKSLGRGCGPAMARRRQGRLVPRPMHKVQNSQQGSAVLPRCARGSFAFVRIKVTFAQADGVGGDFDQFVIVDIGNRLFQRMDHRCRQAHGFIGA